MTAPSPHAPPTAPPPARKLALAALIIGIVAVLTAVVPVLGSVLGIAGIIFGAVALKKGQPKGFSLTGLILGIVATITSIAVTIAFVAMAGNIFAALENASSDTDGTQGQEEWEIEVNGDVSSDDPGGDGPHATDVRIPWNAYDTADAPLSSHAGTDEDPHPLGSRFTVDDTWEVVINMVNRDATEQLLALEPENTPPADGERYVLLNMTVKNLGAEAERVGRLRVQYDAPGRLYPADSNYKLTTPEPSLFTKDLQITGSYTGYVAFRTTDDDGDFVRLAGWASRDRVFAAVK